MRHRHSRKRLGAKPGYSKILKNNLVTSFLLYEGILTTKKRAKVIQPMIDRLIHVAKTQEPYRAIRAINRVVNDKNASRKLMEVIKDRFADRSSGFTRIRPAGHRIGDGAQMVKLLLVEEKNVPKTKSDSAKKS